MGRFSQSEIDALLDRQAIGECMSRYARGLDRADLSLIRSVFHEDAILDLGGFFRGTRDEFLGWVSTRLEEKVSHHIVTNFSVDVDGSVAHSETLFLAITIDDEGVTRTSAGRYIDRLEYRDGGWRVFERVLILEWAGTLQDQVYLQPHDRRTSRGQQDLSYLRPLTLQNR